jgi:hypothetical protein
MPTSLRSEGMAPLKFECHRPLEFDFVGDVAQSTVDSSECVDPDICAAASGVLIALCSIQYEEAPKSSNLQALMREDSAVLKCWPKTSAAVAACCVAIALAPATASAIGYFNMPGNYAQFWGYGCGPGYHACMVLGPISFHGGFRHGVERLPYPPSSPYFARDCSCGAGGYGCEIGGPTLLEPTVEPMPVPGPSIEPTPAPSAFRVPFRY